MDGYLSISTYWFTFFTNKQNSCPETKMLILEDCRSVRTTSLYSPPGSVAGEDQTDNNDIAGQAGSRSG